MLPDEDASREDPRLPSRHGTLAQVASNVEVDDLFARLRERQQPSGAFFRFDGNAGENPEPWWYHELVLLHAITSYAGMTGDPAATEAVRKAATFHHAETQPDHATSQPWAVHAFLSDPEFVPTADLLLLAATMQQPSALGAVPRILLADAAVWLSIA